MSLTSQIKERGEEIGLEVIGITHTESFPEVEERIIENVQKGYIPYGSTDNKKSLSSPYRLSDLDKIKKKCNPRSILKKGRSVISVALGYLIHEEEESWCKGEPMGRVAKYNAGNFYFEVVLKLNQLIDFINQKTDFRYKSKSKSCYVPLVEKPLARRAGVGWYGKQGIILTERFGSWVVLGEIITELELEVDSPLDKDCGSCRICLDSCPTQAIVAPYIIDQIRCLQYISERSMKVPLVFRDMWGDILYGCTICQEVCPRNKGIIPKHFKPAYGYIGSKIPLLPLLNFSEEEFQKYFAYNQIAMRPREAIKRNAVLALGNLGSPDSILPLAKVLKEEESALVRGHAAWALGKIGGKKARSVLEEMLKRESDNEVKEEIIQALEKF